MTHKQFTDSLPRLTNDTLPVKPPFEFTGLSARIFPLRANLDALQKLVNGYVNIVPPEVGRFRAAVPYVYLSLLDYGKISGVVESLGWLAQVEVFFCIPLQWYKLVNGRWQFHDMAVITPYIYVSDDISVPMGRIIYGFPKALAKLTSHNEKWLSSPLAPSTMARLETAIISELYQGKSLEQRVFLEVEQEQPIGNLRIPFDFNSATMPWHIAGEMANALTGVGRDAQFMAQSMRIFPAGPQFLPQMIQQLLPKLLSPSGPGFILNSLNLKQFRRTDSPDYVAYQALTNGPMRTTSFNGGGILGEQRMLLGDLSGGYSVKLHEYTTLPIARSLGLDVHRRTYGQQASVVELKPVAPIWIDVNVTYLEGQNLAWRGQDGQWKNSSGERIKPHNDNPATSKPLFNTTVNSVIDDITGPFEFEGTTVRVLPLLASRRKLQAYIDSNVNACLAGPFERDPDVAGAPVPEELRLSVWARKPDEGKLGSADRDAAYVYLVVSSYDSVSSKSNDVGDWARFELSFMIPVKWESRDNAGNWSLRGVGLYPAYNFVDTSIAAISRHEVQGIPTTYANFVSARNDWLSRKDSFVGSHRDLLSLECEVIPALGLGQKTCTQTVIEITNLGSDATRGIRDSREAARHLANTLRRELRSKKRTKFLHREECKVARALSLELLGNRIPFEIYTLKQFRDVADPARACFQSLQRLPRSLQNVADVREIEATLSVSLCDYPTLSIAETLGIVATPAQSGGRGNTYVAQAIRPFYIRGTMQEGLGIPLLRRAGNDKWHLTGSAFDGLLSTEAGSTVITVNPNSEALQDKGDPDLMSHIMYEAVRVAPEHSIPIDKAISALSVVDPQMMIEALLSREWGSAAENARWRKGRRELKKTYENLFTDFSSDLVVNAEKKLYMLAYESMANRPGSPENLGAPVKRIINRLGEFTGHRVKMEKSFIVLASWSVMRMRSSDDTAAPDSDVDKAELIAHLVKMLQNIKKIAELTIEGEPSPSSNLYPKIEGDHHRLCELLDETLDPILDMLGSGLQVEEKVDQASFYIDTFKESVELARDYSNIQREALINKLARVYQKPDYCIRRDAVGPDRDTLLPMTLSWDENWYYGRKVEPEEQHDNPNPENA